MATLTKTIQSKSRFSQIRTKIIEAKAWIASIFYPENSFITATAYAMTLNGVGDTITFRFTAQNSKTADYIKLRIYNVTGTPPTYRWGIQADSDGEPSGSFLGYADFAPTVSGFITLNISNCSLIAGVTYWIVIKYLSGTIDGSNYIKMLFTGPGNKIEPYDMSYNNLGVFLDYSVGAWSESDNKSPIYQIKYTDGTLEGNPYYASSSVNVHSTSYISEIIEMPDKEINVDSIGFRVWRGSNVPTTSLFYQIWNEDDELLRSGVFMLAATVTTNESWYDKELENPVIFEANKKYRLVLRAPTGSANYYSVRRCLTTNNSEWISTTFQGTKCYYSFSSSGSSWSDYAYYDLVFRMKNISKGSYYPHFEVTADGTNTAILNSQNEKLGFRFISQESKICNVINFYIDTIKGIPPAYRIGIQTTKVYNGVFVPSETWLSYGDIYRIEDTGWFSVELNKEVNLTAGTIYCIVVEYLSETIDSNNCIVIGFLGRGNPIVPYNNIIDNYLSVMSHYTYWFAMANSYPIFMLNYNDMTFFGIPFTYTSEVKIYGNLYYSQTINIFDDYNVPVKGIGFYMKKTDSSLPSDDLYYEIIKIDDEDIVASGTLVNKGANLEKIKWHDVEFSKIFLESTEDYKIILKSPNSDINSCYHVKFLQAERNICLISLTYRSNESYAAYSYDAGVTWTSEHGKDLSFRFKRGDEWAKTIQCKSNIGIVDTVKTIQNKALIILLAEEKTIQAKANLISIINRTINSLSNIKSIVNRTVSSKANIGAKLRFIKTKANITKLISKTVGAKSRLIIWGLKTITAKASIHKVIACTIQAKCNINRRKYIEAKANIYEAFKEITIIARARIIKDFSSLVDAVSRFPRGKIQISWDKSKNLTADGYQYLNESDYLISLESYEELEGAVGESVSSDADIVLANNTERFMPKEFKNKLANPSFELNSTPTYWTENNTGGGINVGTVRTRIRSYKINNANGYVVSNNIYIASGLGEEQILQNENWVFSVYMQGTGTAALKLYAFNTNNEGQDLTTGLLDSNEQTTINLTGGWSRSHINLLVPSGTASLRARFLLEAGGSALYADDAMVERGSAASDFQDITSKINHLLLPNRPVLLDVGFLTGGITSSGVDFRRVFCGIIENLTPDINEEIINIHCIDWSAKLAEMKSPSLMYTNKRTEQLLEYLAWAAGLGITEYIFETGILTIPFAWFDENESVWYWMKKIAEAEGGRIFFDRKGILRFWNRNHYANNQSVQYTYTFNSNISNLNFEVSSEKIINHIIVKAKPREEQPNQIIWALQGYETIPANSSLDYEIAVDDPCTVITEPTANADYLANTQSDGGGNDRTSYITINDFTAKAQKATMTINNTHPSEAIYITLFHVKGKPAIVMHEIEVDVKDTESIDKYKDKILEIENDYIQNIDEAEALAKRRIIELRNPLDFIEIEVIGNPEIKVGDVVRVQNSYDGTTKDLFVVSSRISFADEIVQTLRLESKILNY